MQRVRISAERLVDRAEIAREWRRAVDVQRRSLAVGNGLKRHAITDEPVRPFGRIQSANRLRTITCYHPLISRPRHPCLPIIQRRRTTLEALIQRCLRGDQAAWEQIVKHHWRKVFNVAYKFVGKHDEAEDLTQDIFLKIFKSLDTFDRRANFQTWLISVSRNLCIDHYRSVRKERETIDRDVDANELTPAAPEPGPIAALEQRDRVTLLRAGARGAARVAAHGGRDARHPGAVVSGNRRPAASA